MDRTLTKPALVALLCATADRTPDQALGAEALAVELGLRIDAPPRVVGSPPLTSRTTTYDEDLRVNRGCLLEAGGQIDDALSAGDRPLLFAGDCAIALTTLRTVIRHRPDAVILWLDAHPDFNTPQTSPSQYLGGMALAGACGRWDSGLIDEPPVSPAAVVTYGVRSVDGAEQVALERSGVARIDHAGVLGDALRGRQVFIHIDMDVLDPTVLPTSFPVPGGLTGGALRMLLDDIAHVADELIGTEITGMQDPGSAAIVADALEPLLGEI